MTNKKNIYIHGSFMNDNYGDFLLFYIVNKICLDYNIYPYSTNVDASYKDYCKVNTKSQKYTIENSDMVLFAGGGYFGEPNKKKIYWNIRCLIKHIIPAYKIYKRKIPYAIIGVETGPISLFISRFLLKRIFNNASVISVRNNESKEFLESIKVKNTINVVPDWIMGMDLKELIRLDSKAKDELKKIPDNYKKVFIHLATRGNKCKDNVISDLKDYAEENKNVYYIVGCDQKSKRLNERALKIMKSFSEDRCLFFNYSDPWLLSAILHNCDAVVTDKLHVGIVATKLKKEVISTFRHPKTMRFYNLIGRSYWSQNIESCKKGDILSKLHKLTFKNIEVNEKILLTAEDNEKILRKFIEENLSNNYE